MKRKKESDFQKDLIEKIKSLFPGALVLKNDPTYIQGIPDLMVLFNNKWAMLEVKKSEKELRDPRPNQPYYIDLLNKMSYASFVYPENEEEVLDALKQTFRVERKTRNPFTE